MKYSVFCFFLFAAFKLWAQPLPSLKNAYKNFFTIGVAVSPKSLLTDESEFILRQFGSITAENAMKMGPIHPAENTYNFTAADSIAAFARKNKIRLRGHTLCWHKQVPNWIFTDKNGDTVSKEILLARLRDHITTVVSRYKDIIYAWDVVNEAISDNPAEIYRNSAWYRICGDEFISRAFEYAHTAAPEALLFYNDYNEIDPVKRDKIVALVNSLKEKGVPIHGIGLQAHWSIFEPSEAVLTATLEKFKGTGLQVQITELDLSVYPKEHSARKKNPADVDTLYTDERASRQAAEYKMIFEVFRKYKDLITGITFWNISDRHSWLDNFPVQGRKDYPLLFDKNLQPKPAFSEVVKF